ncbi:hypothetical protein TNIN_173771 [Trichonephila inaurata madagascariensis]|uniref:Uncharacterized protein n=1 Tax=Trichonephila inaurata madagascariensis TaxID=2747483 RepID=A0A8X6YNB8_9ARAC|nr:hypothetical protein TNIN_173771 [Trichonephila inaurata madagascariensis]
MNATYLLGEEQQSEDWKRSEAIDPDWSSPYQSITRLSLARFRSHFVMTLRCVHGVTGINNEQNDPVIPQRVFWCIMTSFPLAQI